MYKDYPITPCIYTRDSRRSSAGRWVDGTNVRFFTDYPQTIGGSDLLYATALSGKCRKMMYFSDNDGKNYIFLGTSKKAYIWDGSALYNCTPYRETGTLSNPFSVGNNSNLVTVADTNHGLVAGETVSFSGATAGGGITISGEYTVTSVTDANAYVITHSSNSTSLASSFGGASVAYKYELSHGLDDAAVGNGWGAGVWRAGGTYSDSRGWGEPDPSGSGAIIHPRLWSAARYGEDVVANPRGGTIYYFDTSAGVDGVNRFEALANAPDTCKFILVDPNGGRNIIAFGAYDDVAGEDNPMLVRWCDTTDPTIWTESLISDAGRYMLSSGTEIMAACPVDRQILILTNTSAYIMSPEEYPYNYSFRLIATDCGLTAPDNLVSDTTGRAMWKSDKKFFKYDGNVSEVDCDVFDEAFDVNATQRFKQNASLNSTYNEVWFSYPTSSSTEVDKVAIYNFAKNGWYFSSLARTAYIDKNAMYDTPTAVNSSNYLLAQETGTQDNNSAFTKSITCVVEADEKNVLYVDRIVNDYDYLNGNITVTATGYKEPMASGFSKEKVISSSNQHTSLKKRARLLEFKFESDGAGDSWKMGKLRLDVENHGER